MQKLHLKQKMGGTLKLNAKRKINTSIFQMKGRKSTQVLLNNII